MQPTDDRVLIAVDKPKDRTTSGLFIQEDWKSLPLTGTVIAFGPNVTTLRPGNRVLFERYASVILEDDQRLCLESHVLAILLETDDAA